MPAPEGFKLQLVQVLFRYGARTCSEEESSLLAHEIDEASSLNKTHGYEQLTNLGKLQAHKLGSCLRERYSDFLGSSYRPSDVHATTSDHDSTKVTTQLCLAGLYPPAFENIWNSEIRSVPIPYHCVPRRLDALLEGPDLPKYRRRFREESSCNAKIRSKAAELMEMNELLEDKGVPSLQQSDFFEWLKVFNALYVHQRAARSRLPDLYTKELFEQLQRHVEDIYDLMSLTPELRKLQVGLLLKRVHDNAAHASNPRKVYLFCADGPVLAAFLRSHRLDRELRCPGFCSAVLLEKWLDADDRAHVRMLVTSGQSDLFKVVTLRGSGENGFCRFEDYKSLTEGLFPSDEDVDEILAESAVNLKNLLSTDYVHCAASTSQPSA
ncbi:hypothetical protein TKK_0018831 [Trichogramma kaykai]